MQRTNKNPRGKPRGIKDPNHASHVYSRIRNQRAEARQASGNVPKEIQIGGRGIDVWWHPTFGTTTLHIYDETKVVYISSGQNQHHLISLEKPEEFIAALKEAYAQL